MMPREPSNLPRLEALRQQLAIVESQLATPSVQEMRQVLDQWWKSEQALGALQLRFASLLLAAPEAIIGIDTADSIIVWNERAEDIFGWSASEVLGASLAETIIPARLRERHLHGLKRLMAGGQSELVYVRLRAPALGKAGNEFPIEFTIGPAREGDAYYFFAYVTATDRPQPPALDLEALLLGR